MTFNAITFEVDEGVARITLARPKQANAFNAEMSAELHEAAILCRDDSAVRAVLLSAQGAMFCGGGDLGAFARAGDKLPEIMVEMISDLHAAIHILSTMNAPVVVAVNGAALGAGLSLVLAGSLIIAADTSGFSVAYSGAGLTPDGGLTYNLPRAVGSSRAEELMLTNRQLSAAEALEWGLVNQVVDEAELMEKAQQTVKRIAQGPTRAYGNIRRLLLNSFDASLEEQLKKEGDSMLEMGGSRDGREGILAFTEKRRPVFKGV
jgi:2-(1,2-epoxy-1,2-dihydrophenyl)acetyl-CoA isomerase